jgi:hypothetical protein
LIDGEQKKRKEKEEAPSQLHKARKIHYYIDTADRMTKAPSSSP